MAPQQRQGAVTRNMLNGNFINKQHGTTVEYKKKEVTSASRATMKFKKEKPAPEAKPSMDLEDLVKAKPPKRVKA